MACEWESVRTRAKANRAEAGIRRRNMGASSQGNVVAFMGRRHPTLGDHEKVGISAGEGGTLRGFQGSQSATDRRGHAMKALRLLLIEDDTDTGDAMRQLLSLEGFTVDVAKTGREALELYARKGPRPDAILLDLMLPDVDGVDLIHRLRAVSPLPPVVIHSAMAIGRVE